MTNWVVFALQRELDGEIAMSANVKVITDGWKQDDCQYKVVFNYGNGLKVFEQECLTLEIAKCALDALVGYTDSLREAGLITKDTYFGQVLVKDGEKWNGLDIKIKLTV